MLATSNRVKDLMVAVEEQLKPLYDDSEARSVASLLFEERFQITKLKVALNPNLRLSESEIVMLHIDLKKLTSGMPLQYVTGYAEFAGLRLKVSPDVLIPRPETEELILLAISLMKDKEPESIMDLGTGSGAIALAVKRKWPQASVFATDISEKTLEVAKENGKAHQLHVNFTHHDMLSQNWPIIGQVNLLLSNPPYIPIGEYHSMHINVKKFEPKRALFVEDADPLLYYRHIGHLGGEHLTHQGWLVVEVHSLYGQEVVKLYQNMGYYEEVKAHFDIHGKHRFVSGRRRNM